MITTDQSVTLLNESSGHNRTWMVYSDIDADVVDQTVNHLGACVYKLDISNHKRGWRMSASGIIISIGNLEA
jgi:hypothetical protein